MKTLTIRLPDALMDNIEADARERKVSKADVVRERLIRAGTAIQRTASYECIADLIGSVDGLPTDLSANKKKYLRATGYGRKRSR